ncbi:putative 1-phosphatidylinositol-3-phosphate 5-kinase FAB1C [Beta vulgaris subsp. vulgaris]|uniref:putative 1-phosphatidylinositol-3-phosphate 5-kinase FAB1C n=1 Tax=Beta vulgaris subsp. vulgaris TaxID=3555 RepID=UPI002036721A|nr:putative 1-phosphatidylinositol-3-phosphate 5-kinase FAB1C [Beta vulgaris subsp. vulgaris]
MGVADNPLLDLIDKVRSWASLGKYNPSSVVSCDFNMAENSCCQCELKFSELCHKYSCLGCKRLLCGSCVRGSGPLAVIATSSGSKNGDHMEKVIKACKLCFKASKRHIGKVYPSESPRASPEPLSPSVCDKLSSNEVAERTEEDCVSGTVGFQDHNFSPHNMSSSRVLSIAGHPSQGSLHHSPIQSDEEPEESGRHFFSSASEYCHENSDIDTSSLSLRNESYSFRSTGSSPLDSPSRFNINTPRAGRSVQQTTVGSPKPQNCCPSDLAILRGHDRGTGDPANVDGRSDEVNIINKQNKTLPKPLDFENNGHIWFPPPPEDEDDEMESNYFEYDDDDDDDVGTSGGVFSSAGNLPHSFPAKESQNEEPLRSVIQGHFRALVSQLLQGEGIKVGKENGSQDWLEIVSNLAWQAANFVKPDTSKGGSMDPGDYVKIKCIASGSPNESTLIKGIVCTKNIKHKRMTSQYKTPRLFLLGGSLEYQRAQNQLASFNTLLEEEMNHLKLIVSKIEAHRPQVLLVEKSVSSYAQEYLLEKEISLVLNVKRPVLERIARCTGALITPSVDNISVARLGHCELFRLEKVSEVLETTNQFNKRQSKTLMFFEGCPRRLGCTVLLKGLCRKELKRVKHVVQFAVFAAYHLSLETSFLADEGAHLPKMSLKPSYCPPITIAADDATSTLSCSDGFAPHSGSTDIATPSEGFVGKMEGSQSEASSVPVNAATDKKAHVPWDGSVADAAVASTSPATDNFFLGFTDSASGVVDPVPSAMVEKLFSDERQLKEVENIEENEVSSDYLAATESHQSILVSFSSRCVSKGTLCERSRLLRIRFYGSFDKPLGRYLRDDLFDQPSVCRSCKEPVEAHVQCYTHRQGVVTINVRRLDTVKLSGERDGKIWMWHRCLRCAQIDNVPPATRRVILSDAAWGLSFGKFLELSFSNHATANRVASCGHSLQRDCLRFYGFGSMVAFFHYSPIDILTVHLPPSVLEFNGQSNQDWMEKEVEELKSKMETFYAEVSDVLHVMEQKSTASRHCAMDSTDLHKHILESEDLLDRERNQYYDSLQQATEDKQQLVVGTYDILELNQLRRSLLMDSHAWDRRFYFLDSLLNSSSFKFEAAGDTGSHAVLKDSKNNSIQDFKVVGDQVGGYAESGFLFSDSMEPSQQGEVYGDGKISVKEKSLAAVPSPASNLSDKIDSAWTGTDVDASESVPVGQVEKIDNLPLKRLMAPVRVHSFDSAMRLEEKTHRRLHSLSQFSTIRSFHASGDYRNMVRDPTADIMRTFSQINPHEVQFVPSFISTSHTAESPRLLLPHTGQRDLVIAVYDDEPTSIISYALSSKEYEGWVSDRWSQKEGSCIAKDVHREDSTVSSFLSWQSFGSLELDYMNYGGYGSEDTLLRSNTTVNDPKKSPHLQISFDDDSSVAGGKVKFSVTCYFAKQFDMLQEKCCPRKLDFVRSLSRCRRWSAQGGKSNVYFAKSMDERFIIKQVTKTELESFQEFAAEYFKYLNDSLDSGSPTCLAKVLGIFQVTVKHLKGGREIKMDLMVMENLFFNRKISKIYDLKGSSRSRYNPDTTGANKVLLDMNLLETLRTNPIFLGSKAKRRLERAVWNDTSFLASVDVMDYSLLVGVDEERKELVLGIIDFMRQYTWDKHLETWVKASGILGGLKNASPTIISPKQYKRRFRKAMTTYFLTVPDQWSS